MKKSIDLNCDMGEYLASEQSQDMAIMPYISSANISCGAHAGNIKGIRETIRFARDNKVKVGAHPSYPDKQNFGRVVMDIPVKELMKSISLQLNQFQELCEDAELELHHIKAHGALYNQLAEDEELAKYFLDCVEKQAGDILIYGMAHSRFENICLAHGFKFAREGFADRQYIARDRLMSRKKVEAVLSDPALVLQQLKRFLEGYVLSSDGENYEVNIQSICVHSDTPNSIILAERIHEFLKSENVEIQAP